jgi:hypothetical protein
MFCKEAYMAMALRQKAIDYIGMLDEEQTMRVITYIENLQNTRKPLQNSKTDEERKMAVAAFSDLEKMTRHTEDGISLNGRDEWMQAFWSKYESLS